MLKNLCPVVNLTCGENVHTLLMEPEELTTYPSARSPITVVLIGMDDATSACIATTATANDLATTSAPAPRAVVARVIIGETDVHWYDLPSLLPNFNNFTKRSQFPLDIFHDHLTGFVSLPDFGSSLRITSLSGYRSVNSYSTKCASQCLSVTSFRVCTAHKARVTLVNGSRKTTILILVFWSRSTCHPFTIDPGPSTRSIIHCFANSVVGLVCRMSLPGSHFQKERI